jgi:hypothetical protein
MPALYSTLRVTEPDYGERIVRVRGGVHYAGVSHTTAVDLVTGERLSLPISTRWDTETHRNVRVCADGWSWRSIPLGEAERRAGLPKGSVPPYSSDTTRCDLWVDERMRNPAFIALLTILTDHPDVVFYSVDWRSWVHHTQPREHPHRDDSTRLTAPAQTSCMGAGRHLPYPLGGSGDMERYASSLSRLLPGASSPAVDRAPETVDTLSAAVLADLRDDYEDIVQWQQRPDRLSRLHHTAPADMPVARSLADIQDLAGWTRVLLASLDELYDQTRARALQETAAYRPQSVALSLF